MLAINLLDYQSSLVLRQQNGKKEVFDPVRRKWLVLTPEETVRQLTLLYLFDATLFPKNRYRTEMFLMVNKLPKRCDILIFDSAAQPFFLVECKAPNVPMTEAVLYQALRYNLTLKVQFCLLTNGVVTHLFRLDYQTNSWEELLTLVLSE